MDAIGLLDLIQKGESSTVQFKVRIEKKGNTKSAYDVGTEMVAFANTKGGMLIIGVEDGTGDIKGLSYQEIQATNELLTNAASNNVKPSINIHTETVEVNQGKVVIAEIPEGISKPHTDNKGIMWIKNGPDKTTVTATEEMARLLQSTGNLYADETPVKGTTVNDIDEVLFAEVIEKKHQKPISALGLPTPVLLSNMGMMKGESITLAGLLLFGKNPQRFKPTCTVQCVSIVGDNIGSKEYRDKEDPFTGNLKDLYEKTRSFIIRNLKKIQKEESFNSPSVLEIPMETIEELLVNALVHRDYFISSNIKVLIFDNRIEITSPGKLPNTLTIENIKAGTSIQRNQVIYSNARHILPFTGIGSGIIRALQNSPSLGLVNDTERGLFTATIKRET